MGAILKFMEGYYVNPDGTLIYDMATAPVPAAEYTWMIAIIIIALIALWQARTFVSQF
jgi:hypothetical protein